MHRPSEPTACIFDFDGTLVNSMDQLVSIAGHTLAQTHGLAKSEAERLYLLTSGLPFCEQVDELFPSHPRNAEAVRKFEEEKLKSYPEHKFFADAEATVGYLKQKGMRVVISSSNHQEVVDHFIENGPIRFDLVLGYKKNFTKGKCHFSYIQNTLGITPDGMIFIGDSLRDAARACSEHIPFIAKAGLTSRADFHSHYPTVPVIDHLAELRGLL